MFKDINKPTMSELIEWFGFNYPTLWNQMAESNHSANGSLKLNPYHLEESVLTHTMMVSKLAEIESTKNYSKINLVCALLHDIGKPMSREIIEKDDKVKVRFSGHEGISYHLSVEILLKLKNLGVLTKKEVQSCLWIISQHGNLFDYIKDGKKYKENKVFSKFI